MIRVLHVDDDRALLELAQNFLKQSGDLIVDTAISGKVAHRMLGEQHYDAIVSDYAMPGCNGIDLLRHVRRTDERTPFLFFSDQLPLSWPSKSEKFSPKKISNLCPKAVTQ